MNDEHHRKALVAEALAHWQGREPLEAGRLLFEDLPNGARPAWAAQVLRLVLERSGLCREATHRASPTQWLRIVAPQREQFPHAKVEHVLMLAASPKDWHRAHDAFSAVRSHVLKLDQLERSNRLSSEQDLHLSVLSLAELVAKVTYNASDPLGPFDEDSGWCIVASLRAFIDHGWPNDVVFAEAAWSTLISAAPSAADG